MYFQTLNFDPSRFRVREIRWTRWTWKMSSEGFWSRQTKCPGRVGQGQLSTKCPGEEFKMSSKTFDTRGHPTVKCPEVKMSGEGLEVPWTKSPAKLEWISRTLGVQAPTSCLALTHHVFNWELWSLSDNVSINCNHSASVVILPFPVTSLVVCKHVDTSILKQRRNNVTEIGHNDNYIQTSAELRSLSNDVSITVLSLIVAQGALAGSDLIRWHKCWGSELSSGGFG